MSSVFRKANVTPPETLWAEASGWLTTSGDKPRRFFAVVGAGFDGLHFADAPNLADSRDKYAAAGRQLLRWKDAFSAARPGEDVTTIEWTSIGHIDLTEMKRDEIGSSIELTIQTSAHGSLRLWNEYAIMSGCDRLAEFARRQLQKR